VLEEYSNLFNANLPLWWLKLGLSGLKSVSVLIPSSNFTIPHSGNHVDCQIITVLIKSSKTFSDLNFSVYFIGAMTHRLVHGDRVVILLELEQKNLNLKLFFCSAIVPKNIQ